MIVLMHVLQMIPLPQITAGGKQEKKISLLEGIGKSINPVFRPMGISAENWQASVALVSGLFAKEAIVGSLQSTFRQEGSGDVSQNIQQYFKTTSAGFAFLLFILLYSPCAAALAVLWREQGRRWMLFSFLYLTLLAWIVSTAFYQVTRLGVELLNAVFWLGVCLLLLGVSYFFLKFMGRIQQDV